MHICVFMVVCLGLQIVEVSLHATNKTRKIIQSKRELKLTRLFSIKMRNIVYWNSQGSGEHEFTIYIHARPGYSYTDKNTKCHYFVDRQLKNSIQV